MIRIMIALTLTIGYSQNQNITTMDCSDCHGVHSWLPLSNEPLFNHNTTRYTLLGQHQFADCIQCHIGNTVEEKHQFSNLSTECKDCHFDVHLEANGLDCERCHSPISWETSVSGFNHELTLFPLAGMHRLLLCSHCHNTDSQNWTSWLPTDCNGCHQSEISASINAGNHPENTDCILCHNTWSWSPIDMSHHDILFPIYSGKHQNEWTSCTAECHINPNDYAEYSCGLNGVCHDHRKSEMDDEHAGKMGYVYESSACYQCHPSGSEHD